jgi:UDP-N-acetylmuramate dehydrogenase
VSAGAPFGARTTLRVGGEAAELVEVESLEQLAALAANLDASRAVYVLGRGSNTLVADAGFDGVVLHLGEAFSTIELDGTRLVAGGAADLPVVARQSVEAGLSGFEWAVGVPGTIGGAVAMNAGGHGSDMAASLVSAAVFDLERGELLERSAAELDFGYRHSAIGPRQVVCSAVLDLVEGDRERGRQALRDIVRWRREHQPGGANCGSVFTNPPDASAGELIEAAGLKGARLGTASVSAKHANFIQADQGGAADDVVALMADIVEAVERSSGVCLQTEVRLVGFEERQLAHLRGEHR